MLDSKLNLSTFQDNSGTVSAVSPISITPLETPPQYSITPLPLITPANDSVPSYISDGSLTPPISIPAAAPSSTPSASLIPLSLIPTPTPFIQKLQIKMINPEDSFAVDVTYSIPYETLLNHIQTALLLIIDNNGYISYPVKVAVQELILCKAFTNLDLHKLDAASLTMTELYEMYDIVKSTGIATSVRDLIDSRQYDFYEYTLDKTIESILTYRNSVAGMVELLAAKNEELKTSLSDTLSDFNDPDKIGNVIKMADLLAHQNSKI